MGLLNVTGTIALDQFWPTGLSDGDTTKVLVSVAADSFKYQQRPGGPFVVTDVFRDAVVRGKIGPKPAIDKKGRITVRLQGIDAPELHYRASPLGKKRRELLSAAQLARLKVLNKEYRQHFGETATAALRAFLGRIDVTTVPCRVFTRVARPTDIFDTYGRFIGDIVVRVGKLDDNVNQWLVRMGWAFPAFYNSMTEEEIEELLHAAELARKKNRIWPHLQSQIGKLDLKLVFRGKGAALEPSADVGPVLMPKLFRRLCTWTIHRKVGAEKNSFKDFLAAPSNTCYLLSDFIDNGIFAAVPHKLSEFLTSGGKFTRLPQDLVFKEDPSRLVGPDGKEIITW